MNSQSQTAQTAAKIFLKGWNDRPTSQNTRTFMKNMVSRASGDLEILLVWDLINLWNDQIAKFDVTNRVIRSYHKPALRAL